MRMSILLSVTALAAITAGAALAQPPGGGRGPAQTPEERAAAFKAADKNADGKLDKTEFATTLPEQFRDRADQVFPGRDANSDGFISLEEYNTPGRGRGGGGGGAPGGGRPQ